MESQAMAHLAMLAGTIGERAAGTPGHHQAEAYIRREMAASGLEMSEVRLDFPDWRLEDASLTLAGRALPLDVNPFSPSCAVSGPLVALSTLGELEAADLAGRVALLYGELARAPIFPIRFEPVQFERDQAINRLLMEKAPLAVLAVRPQLWHRLHIFEDEDFPLSSATVRPDVGRALLASPNAPVVLSIRTQSARSHVATLVGRTAPGRQRRIALCAHYDTKFGTPGAHDNGTGVALLLALAARLADRDLAAGLDFVAFADEEYGAHTDGAYATQVGDGFADMVCAINLDGVGVLTENTTLTMLAQGEAFEQAVRAIMAGYPQVVWTDPWIQSNHYTYFARGVPSVALSSLTWERAHQAEDSIDWISPARLDEAMALVEAIVLQASQQTPAWSRPDEGPPAQ